MEENKSGFLWIYLSLFILFFIIFIISIYASNLYWSSCEGSHPNWCGINKESMSNLNLFNHLAILTSFGLFILFFVLFFNKKLGISFDKKNLFFIASLTLILFITSWIPLIRLLTLSPIAGFFGLFINTFGEYNFYNYFFLQGDFGTRLNGIFGSILVIFSYFLIAYIVLLIKNQNNKN